MISIIYSKRHFINILLLILNFELAHSQSITGGRSSFQFLNVSSSTRNTALGSNAIAWTSSDPSSSYFNPALISDKISNHISFNQLYYFDGINFGNFSYTHHPIQWGIQLQAGVHYVKISNIPIVNEYSEINGETKVGESDFFLAASKRLNERIQFGASMHYLYSNLGLYSSSGLSFTAGVNYVIPEKNTEFAFVIRNIGFAFDPYQYKKERIPSTAELGFARRLKHIPFVMHITVHHLESWNVRYDDPEINAASDLFGNINEKSSSSKFIDNMFRHLSFGGEMLIGKSESFSLRLGYNHLRRMEVNINDYSLFGGFSFGFGFKVYMFKFDFTHANYHLAGGTNQIGITTNIRSFYKSKS
ncbi:MAG: type IX secretion system protein PorQ [Saprospiraceae bacterium]